MSRLDELIQELCPDGVPNCSLSDVAEYSKLRTDAELVDDTSYVGVDNLLPNKQGKRNSEYVPTEGRLTAFVCGDVLIGNIRPYLKRYGWLHMMAELMGMYLLFISKIEIRYNPNIFIMFYLPMRFSCMICNMQRS